MNEIINTLWLHADSVAALIIAVASVAWGVWTARNPTVLARSAAFSAFMQAAREALLAAAHDTHDAAQAARNKLDRAEADYLAGKIDKEAIKRAVTEYVTRMGELKKIAVDAAWNQVKNVAPKWMTDAYSVLSALLEQVLPLVKQARAVFSRRNSTPAVPSIPQGESK